MFASFLERLGGLLDRRFVVAYWMPVFVAAALLAGSLSTTTNTAERALRGWMALGTFEQALLGAGALLCITVLAYVLEALTSFTIRWYEGYLYPLWLARRLVYHQGRERDSLGIPSRGDEGNERLEYRRSMEGYRRYFSYPQDENRLRPTRLGNVLTAAEEHSFNLIGLDAVLWWPRLLPLLPEPLRAQIDAAFTPMVALLNLASLVGGLALIGGAYTASTETRWWVFLLVFGGGVLLARVCYHAAVTRAVDYGMLVRAAFDLHRHALLTQLGIGIPKNRQDERSLWLLLNDWLYSYEPPDARYLDWPRTQHRSWMAAPFEYMAVGGQSTPSVIQAAEPKPLLSLPLSESSWLGEKHLGVAGLSGSAAPPLYRGR